SALDPEDRQRVKARLAEAIRDLRTLVRVECAMQRLPELRQLTVRGETRTQQYLDGHVWSELWLDPVDVHGLRQAGFRVESVATLV
ncbi:MAG: hypothetical protein KC729_20245, partial [Candidatus Eisenbacteria bacterium]|nr:hypothetical protein [Candidatus Eisenbacteria bacterium]